MLRKCIVLAVILALIFNLSACGLVPTKAPTEPATPGTTPTTIKELEGIKITAEDLIEEYKTNEIAADHNYKNHTLVIVGLIADISRDPATNKPYVSLTERVQCLFDKEDELLRLVKGEEVIVKGKCIGKKEDKEGTSFPILFKNCSLIEKTEFQITDWKIVKPETYTWCLEISFIKFGYSLCFSLINPEGVEAHSLPGGYGAVGDPGLQTTEGKARLPLPGTAVAGQYKLLVKDSKENVVTTETFNFSGACPKVEILGYKAFLCSLVKSPQEYGLKPSITDLPLGTFCCLYEINLKIKNDGDLPFRTAGLEVLGEREIAKAYTGKRENGEYIYTFPDSPDLGPGEEGAFKAHSGAANYGLWFSSSGEQRLALNFRESGSEDWFSIGRTKYSYGRVVYSMNTTIIIPEPKAEGELAEYITIPGLIGNTD